MSALPTLSIIGCGKLGRSLARMFVTHDSALLADVLNVNPESSARATAFIGAGRVARGYQDLRPVDIFLIAAPDDQIETCCAALAESGTLSARSVVFHCSGALPSSALAQASAQGASVASIHPIRSFAMPEKVIEDFAGTYCGVEGDPRALDLLTTLFNSIGARFVPIDRDAKVLYHAAAVFASNYLVTLLDTAIQTYAKAGIPQDVALKMMSVLVRETTSNVLQTGPERALTGPIARGDMDTVTKQYRALTAAHPAHGRLYKQLGIETVHLANRRKQGAD
ncbi:Rossmann-like and DUF2520 domain-containing protein [Oxalicibacterium faecigallinarum]|uniref:DUF2520 domain-containing protein n=1 Tax=Oxalicibacterium faecigallinarum TaxID=573741 RepID=A0A8J3F0P4_9BURK|nr:Rossmann-like and DUF2520 domain-containing protein [Oxalicibacterium faecigallinarum]GGI16552.1 hypothetical protein GCM10008066_04530 [Oxalicibacterium faecigallinarum]